MDTKLFDEKATTREELVDSRTPEFIALEQRIAHGVAEPGDSDAFAKYRDAEKRIFGDGDAPPAKKKTAKTA